MTDEKEVLELLLKYVSDWNCASADEYPYFTDELGHACNDAIKLIDYKNKENTKLKAEIEQFADELISVRIENELLKKKNELTNHYFEQYAAAIDEIEQLKSELEQSVNEKAEVISKIEYALNECEPIYNGYAFIPRTKPVYDLAMNYCLDLLKGQV